MYVCETKFNKVIDSSVIEEVKDKVRRLAAPKAMTLRKVFICSGELDQTLKESIYFDRMICVDEMLR